MRRGEPEIAREQVAHARSEVSHLVEIDAVSEERADGQRDAQSQTCCDHENLAPAGRSGVDFSGGGSAGWPGRSLLNQGRSPKILVQ